MIPRLRVIRGAVWIAVSFSETGAVRIVLGRKIVNLI